MSHFSRILLLALSGCLALTSSRAQMLRPPAYPLITHDPYFSIWSNTDQLTDSPTRHWTGRPHSLEGIVRVDGKSYQFLGAPPTLYQALLPTGETKRTTRCIPPPNLRQGGSNPILFPKVGKRVRGLLAIRPHRARRFTMEKLTKTEFLSVVSLTTTGKWRPLSCC